MSIRRRTRSETRAWRSYVGETPLCVGQTIQSAGTPPPVNPSGYSVHVNRPRACFVTPIHFHFPHILSNTPPSSPSPESAPDVVITQLAQVEGQLDTVLLQDGTIQPQCRMHMLCGWAGLIRLKNEARPSVSERGSATQLRQIWAQQTQQTNEDHDKIAQEGTGFLVHPQSVAHALVVVSGSDSHFSRHLGHPYRCG